MLQWLILPDRKLEAGEAIGFGINAVMSLHLAKGSGRGFRKATEDDLHRRRLGAAAVNRSGVSAARGQREEGYQTAALSVVVAAQPPRGVVYRRE